MSENTINIKVGVDDAKLKPLLTQLKLLETSFKQDAIGATTFKNVSKDLEKQINSLRLSTEQFQKAQTALTTSNLRVDNSFRSLSGSFRDLQQAQHLQTQASNRSQQGFVALAYIIQDLPYGIRGVANNITQLSQVLGTPIWLNLAISGFTSLAVVFDRQLTGAINNASKALDNFNYKALNASVTFQRYSEKTGSEILNIGSYSPARLGRESSFYQTQIINTDQRINKEKLLISLLQDKKKKEGELSDIEEQEILQREANIQNLNSLYKDQLAFLTAIADRLREIKNATTLGSWKTAVESSWDNSNQFGIPSGETRQQRFNRGRENPEGQSRAYVRRQNFSMGMRNDNAADRVKTQANDLREAMQVANSVFFNPMRSAFESIITGSANMADAFEKAIKQMLASLIANAALAAIISLIFNRPFMPVFQGLNGIPASGDSGDGGSNTMSSAAGNIMRSNNGAGIRIEVVGKIGNDAIYLAGNRYLSDKNAARI